MKTLLTKILLITIALFLVAGLVTPVFVSAQETTDTNSASTGSGVGALVGRAVSGALNFGVDVLLGLFGRLIAIILWIFSWFLYFAGWIFDTAINFSITSGAFRAENVAIISIGWPVVRDFASLFIVLAMLVIAIATMLRLEKYSYKTALPNLILAALLISFSLPIGQFVIDASNVITVGLYNNITAEVRQDSDMAAATSVFKVKLNTTKDISSIFARGLSVTDVQVASGPDAPSFAGRAYSGMMSLIVSGIMGIIVILVASFVLVAFGMLFIARTITLWLVLVFSPAAFVGMIFPSTQQYANEWWKILFKQSFFAPIAMFMIWLVSKFLENDFAQAAVNHATAQGFTSGFTSSMQMVMQYIVLIFLLWKTLTLSQSFGAHGAETVVKKGLEWKGYASDAVKRVGKDRAGRVLDRALDSQGRVGQASRAVLSNRVSSALGITRGVLSASNKAKEAREYTRKQEAELLKGLSPREQARMLRSMSSQGALQAFSNMSDDDRNKAARELEATGAGSLGAFAQTLRAAAAADPRSRGVNGQLNTKFQNDTMEDFARAALPHNTQAALAAMNPAVFVNGQPPAFGSADSAAAASTIATLMNKMKPDQRADVFTNNNTGADPGDLGQFMRQYFAQNGSINDINKNARSMAVGNQMLNILADESLGIVGRRRLEAEAEQKAHEKVQRRTRNNAARANRAEIDEEIRRAYASHFEDNDQHNLAHELRGTMGSVLFSPTGARVRNPS